MRYFLKNIYLICFLAGISLMSFGHKGDTLTFINPSFTVNKGQWSENVLFRALISNGCLWIERDGLTFDLQNADDLEKIADFKANYGQNISNGKQAYNKVRRHTYKILFEGCKSNVRVEGLNELPDYENYFIGNDPSHWAVNVAKYTSVIYTNVYEGIDLKIYGSEGFLKWDFIVKPQADANQIKLKYLGVKPELAKNGSLSLKTNAGKIIEMKPFAYQYDTEGKQKIERQTDFVLRENMVTFLIGEYSKTNSLIIDPTLVYASYTGSTADNWGYTATYDNFGNIIAGGAIFSPGKYPTNFGALDSTFNGGICDIGITKFNTSNSQLIYSTYLGGSGAEVPSSLVVNSSNELLILSTTGSSDFPTHSTAFDNSFNGGLSVTLTSYINFTNGSDLTITRLSANGNQILGSTYFGGTGNDGMNAASNLDYNYADKIRGEILTDRNNNIYVVSSTNSLNLPTSTASLQPSIGGSQDGLILKIDNNLSTLIWCTYLGGNFADALYSISLFKNDDIAVTGGTGSTNLNTTTGCLQPTYNGGTADGFIATLSKNGNQIYALTYYGSTSYDQSFFVDIDRKDHVYVYGQTKDTTNKFIFNALYSTLNGGQFVSKLSKTLSSVVWSTNWGTTSAGQQPDDPDVSPSAFMVDLCNRVYMSAWGGATNYFGTTSGLPITPGAFQSLTDGSDYYFITLKDDASALDYATFYGGAFSHEHVDGGTSRFDQTGKLYQSVCAGCGGYSDFPTTTGCHSAANLSSNCNNAVIKFSFNVPVIIADFTPPAIGCAPYQVSFVNTSYIASTASHCFWDFGTGATSTNCNPTYTFATGGIYNVKLIVYDTNSCNIADTIVKQVAVIEGQRDTLPEKRICIGEFTQIGLLPISDPNVSYIWNNSNTLSNSTISNPIATPLTSTYYTLLFSNGICTDTLVQLVEVLNINANAGNDTSLCFSNITLKASTNYPGLTYQWSSSKYFTDTLNISLMDSTLTTTVSSPTWFYIKISDSYTCWDFDSVLVEPRIVLSNPSVTNPKCFGETNGTISLSPTGGKLPYIFNWSNGSSSANLSNLGAGSYSVTITDQDGCNLLTTINLTEPQELISNSANLNIPCQQACIGKAYSTPSGGTQPYQWQWNDPALQTTNPATNLCDGVYLVTITDQNLCTTYDTITIIDSSIYVQTNAYVTKDTIYEGQQVQIMSNYHGASYTYLWTPANGLNNSNINNPTASPLVSTTYYLTLTDPFGCIWYDTVFIYVIDVICEEPYVFVPNAFTPDGDGKNDILYVRSSVGYEMEFKIFNRWGELVFQSNNVDNGWDGTFKGKRLEPGVFDYYLSLTCYNREIFVKKGNITLIR